MATKNYTLVYSEKAGSFEVKATFRCEPNQITMKVREFLAKGGVSDLLENVVGTLYTAHKDTKTGQVYWLWYDTVRMGWFYGDNPLDQAVL